MCSSAPAPTPPRETSAAATGTNVSTGIANAYLQNMNEISPEGTRTFEQTGSASQTDPYTGETYEIPRFTVTSTRSDAEQGIFDQDQAARFNLSSLGNNLSGQLGEQLTGNFSLGNEETEARLFDLGRQRLDPMFARNDEDLRTRLSNQGIKVGSQAYDREMDTQNRQETDAYNQLLLTGRGQASQELMAEDNQRINQISALLSGGQVSQPNFTTANGINAIQGTDNAQIIGNYDNQNLASWQQSQAALGSMIGGIGGLFAM